MAKLKDILTGIAILLTVGLASQTYIICHKIETLLGQATTTVQITDTITNWKHDTMYFHSYIKDTLVLADTAIMHDTITNTQFVEVQVPIYTYMFDTSIVIHPYSSNFSDTLTVGIFERVRGYGVTIDTLTLDYKAIVTPIKPERKLKFRVVPAVGLGYGTGGWGVFGGVGLSYW